MDGSARVLDPQQPVYFSPPTPWARAFTTMSDSGELDDLYQEVWAGFSGPNGTKIIDDYPMTASLDSPMLPEERATYTHGSLPARTMSVNSVASASSANSSVTQSTTRGPRPLPRPLPKPPGAVSAPPAVPQMPPSDTLPPPPLPPKRHSADDYASRIGDSMLSPPEARLSPFPSGMLSPVSASATSQLEYWDSPVDTELSYQRPESSMRPADAMAPAYSGRPPSPPDDVGYHGNDVPESNGHSSNVSPRRYDESSAGPAYSAPNDYHPPPNGNEYTNGYGTNGNATNGYDSGYHEDSYPEDPRADPFFSFGESPPNVAGPSNLSRSPTGLLQVISNYNENERRPLELHDEAEEDEYWDEEEEDDETRFINFSLLSHVAVQFRDKVPRGTHVKGSIPYPRAFTGKDVVTTIQSQIQRDLAINHGISTNDRRAALQVARSLQSQLFFYEVEWGGRVLQDGVEDVYMFLDDLEGPSDAAPDREELPTAVVTMLTKCYSPSCGEGVPCYSFSCPSRGNSIIAQIPGPAEAPVGPVREAWIKTVPREVIVSLPDSEINRQTIIHKLISKEEQYLQDLDIVESIFIRPLRAANPPVIAANKLEDFIDEVFGNILDLRECNRRLLEVVYVRQREQAPVIQRIGDIFLDAATEFRLAYPIYVGHHPLAEKRMKEELDANPQFRLFIERCSRQSARTGARMDLKHFLNRPSEHLQKYPVLLEAIYHETAVGNPDADYLLEAIGAIKNLQSVAQLRTFQTAMGKGIPGKWEWHDLVAADVRQEMRKEEAKRQSIIFELIKGEMAYVKDLENIEIMYIRPLRNADPPIVPTDRLDQFIKDVFHNVSHLHAHHRALVEKLHEIQREQHPRIRSITEPVLDAALNFREAYLDYIPNYPIAAYRIDDEMANNPAFKAFVEISIRHNDAHRLDMKNFINRPIPRLLRYELLLKGILEETPVDHSDRYSIPQLLEIIKALGKESEPGVGSAKQKVELWRYNSNIAFKPGEWIDMDLLDENRSLIYAGKLLRQPESGRTWNELYVLLFDNYLVMTKPKEKDGVMKYNVVKRPIPLDLLTLVNFTDPPTQRGTGLLRNLRGDRFPGGDSAGGVVEGPADSRSVYPCTLHHNARVGGSHILYAESAPARAEWQQKLEEALGLRRVVQESNKVFELEMLSTDTFLVPSLVTPATAPAYHENSLTGKVTCSVPFNTTDGRGLVAIGCAEGVWIGFRHDSRSMRRVLHLKMVTQCAMLEDFGIFLVLADKSLFAYHIEALVPSSPQSANATQTPQKLNGNVQFFSVGSLLGRTLVIFMKRKNVDSIFHVVEPIIDKINERAKAPAGIGSRFGFRQPKSDWFRPYRDFFLPSESFDVMFLKARIAILCTKGFEIMDLLDFKSVTIPQREDPRLANLAKRCEACRPMGMFRSTDEEFLLVYNEFGLYVNKHGDPSPSRPVGTVEWEGTAERVAFHAPYILLFDTRFIEVRDVETGRLAQIIPGNDMHCLWDGRGQASNSNEQNLADHRNGVLQEARVHGVMNAPDPPAQPGRPAPRAVAQHVFELIPTIPLYLPGSLASPSTTTYFSSSSPPHSPQLRPMTAYRSHS
ncbi:Dbl-like domain-containing protein [Mycena alexandri]|uniref:Dbl-like domain-containing protein n=1 Tax=Mycena alexandri TaxID=1745969 RepID=A0AAD6SYV9_9AGAR|nr:Dbl-like domain-containing protein [Mycena alexandri]